MTGLLYVVLDFPELRDADAVEVHDGARGLDHLAIVSQRRAHRQPFSLKLLVLDDEALKLSFGRRDLIQLVQVEVAELFDVDRSTVLPLLSAGTT